MLGTVKSRVLESDGVSKTAKMKLLSAAALKAIVKLLQWRGPRHKYETPGNSC